VHHLTIQINHQPDATVFQFIILTFVYSSTITTIRRWNQRLPLQSLSSWRWAGKRPKHV